ncbi:flagellar type III secretion system pore protein FliP [Crassaminicella thermophila]|uniref:Flagellar biosynthetic protein FliP n=1 Tax=Crassaminicella thermophila TaxID=2599308 RepID=A0A5C0SEA6_CRATE|nr:flagellar type III secretion system pore protein FliP [Crassaminicella thermophila]QEK12262.1 flagellar type III secretion system pore protein FliP [Crassaminicella thermophila]
MRKKGVKRSCLIILLTIFLLALSFSNCFAEPKIPIPKIGINIDKATNPTEVANSLEIIFLLTILALAPSILMMMTCFTRIIIVLSFIRKAIATQTTPPNQVLIGLALFLTFFIMAPIGSEINEKAIQPYLNKQISVEEALDNAMKPIRSFMFKQTREKDLALFIDISGSERPKRLEDIPSKALIPAFIISELKTGFQIGYILFIPFVVIDMVVASTLMSMGMMMLPPVMISLPFKILLFILVDGWNLIIKSLIMGFK